MRARCDYAECKAIIKAMLNSPLADESDTCVLFNSADFMRLKSRDGKLMSRLTEADALITSFRDYLRAYSRLDDTQVTRLSSQFEVKAVMHCFDKKVGSRTSFATLLHALNSSYEIAKGLDALLPSWNLLQKVRKDTTEQETPVGALRQMAIDGHGRFQDGELARQGFKVGTCVVPQKTAHGGIHFEITSLGSNEVVVHARRSSDLELVEIKRTDLLSTYRIIDIKQIWVVEGYPSPAHNKSFLRSVFQGQLQNAILLEFNKSSNCDEQCSLRLSPTIAVVGTKKWSAGAFKLIPLTHIVTVTDEHKLLPEPFVSLGHASDLGNVYMKNSNTLLRSLEHDDVLKTAFISKFFILRAGQVSDQRIANCEYSTVELKVSVASRKYSVELPVIINNKVIKEGDPIVVVSSSIPEPAPQKKAKAMKRQ